MSNKKISQLPEYTGSPSGFQVPGVANGETQRADLGAMVFQAIESDPDIPTRSDVDSKQDILVSGTNIKTINGQSVLGTGNIHITGGEGGSTDYRELSNKPCIDAIELTTDSTPEQLGLQRKLTDEQLESIDNVHSKAEKADVYTKREVDAQINSVTETRISAIKEQIDNMTTPEGVVIPQNIVANVAANKTDIGNINNLLNGNNATTEIQITPEFKSGYVSGSTGEYAVNPSGSSRYVEILNLQNAKNIRFLGLYTAASYSSGYSFYKADGTPIGNTAWPKGASSNQTKEYILNVPEGAVAFRTTAVSSPLTTSNFYIYVTTVGTGAGIIDRLEALENRSSESPSSTAIVNLNRGWLAAFVETNTSQTPKHMVGLRSCFDELNNKAVITDSYIVASGEIKITGIPSGVQVDVLEFDALKKFLGWFHYTSGDAVLADGTRYCKLRAYKIESSRELNLIQGNPYDTNPSDTQKVASAELLNKSEVDLIEYFGFSKSIRMVTGFFSENESYETYRTASNVISGSELTSTDIIYYGHVSKTGLDISTCTKFKPGASVLNGTLSPSEVKIRAYKLGYITGLSLEVSSNGCHVGIKENGFYESDYAVSFSVPVFFDYSSEESSNHEQTLDQVSFLTKVILRLPKNYSPDGEKVPLVVFRRGNGGFYDYDGMNDFGVGDQSYASCVRYLNDEGYAVLDFHPNGSLHKREDGCGSMLNFACMEAAVKTTKAMFNISDDLYCMAKSFGGQQMAQIPFGICSLPVKAIALLACQIDPILNAFGHANGTNDIERRNSLKFMGISDDDIVTICSMFAGKNYWSLTSAQKNTFKSILIKNTDKLLRHCTTEAMSFSHTFAQLLDLKATIVKSSPDESLYDSVVRHGSVPVKAWVAKDDDQLSWFQSLYYIKSLANGGCSAELRIMPNGTGSHHSVDTSTKALKATKVTTKLGLHYESVPLAYYELVKWFRKFE